MTTDLTDDFGLGEEEFDWDVFVPDPDDAEVAAEAAALEDEDELDLDDSEFDWEAALREDPETEAAEDGGARAGAAYDRIVDTVRRSVEEPEPEAESDPAFESVPVQTTETLTPTESGPEAEEFPIAPEPEAEPLQGFWVPETEFELEPEAEPELEEAAGWAFERNAGEAAEMPPEWGPEAFVPTEGNVEAEVVFEPEPEAEWEPVEARIAEMAATVASVGQANPPRSGRRRPGQRSPGRQRHGSTTAKTRPRGARSRRRPGGPVPMRSTNRAGEAGSSRSPSSWRVSYWRSLPQRRSCTCVTIRQPEERRLMSRLPPRPLPK